MSNDKTILVTSALPYANGPIHIGHLVEYIQTDIFVRYQKLRGRKCYYFCADDAHGTPIMLTARALELKPEELIAKFSKEHQRDFAKFDVSFDNYYSTHSDENKYFVEYIYGHLKDKGNIAVRDVEQFYCEKDTMFLPDRFIRGICPRCGAEDQYGDVCEICGASYNVIEIKEPRCSTCGSTPVRKISKHFFFKLNDYKKELVEWINGGHVQEEVKNKLQEWLTGELRDWDISRDGPYFGFPIPGEENKYFYVWVDAPIGYIASTKNFCTKNNIDFDALWFGDKTDIYHFIGKDIMYFHCLFWPAMLMGSGITLPKEVCIHGFLTVDGVKMSKSRGTFVKAEVFAKHIEPQFLRYYYASKLTNSIDDIDLSLEDFVNKINADIVGNVVNLFSRAIKLMSKLDYKLGKINQEDSSVINSFLDAAPGIAESYETRNFSKAVKDIMALFNEANKFFNDTEPWIVIKNDPEKARGILTVALNAALIGSVYLKPILPTMVDQIEKIMNVSSLNWDKIESPLEEKEINPYERLAERIDAKQIEKIIEESREA